MKSFRVLLLAASIATVAAAIGAAQSAAPAAPALGQPGSLIETYGVIDVGVRASSHESAPSGETYIGASQGLFNGSRVGFRGTDQLMDGVKGVYTLELGVIEPYGVLDQQAQIFGRQAWVGLNTDYGQLAIGRQYGSLIDAVAIGDVFGNGNMGYVSGGSPGSPDSVNTFWQALTGYRWDNSVKYSANFSGITVGAMAMFGNVVGNVLSNSMVSASVGYKGKDLPVSGAVAFQYENDPNQNYHAAVGTGVKFAIDATDGVYAFYIHSVYETGFARGTATNSEYGTPLLNRIDDAASLSANYYVMPSLNVIAAYYFDYAQNVVAVGDTGMRNSGLLAADYYFSKSFDMYLAGWYSLFSGGFLNSKNGGLTSILDSGATGAYPLASANIVAAGNNFADSLSVMVGARFRF